MHFLPSENSEQVVVIHPVSAPYDIRDNRDYCDNADNHRNPRELILLKGNEFSRDFDIGAAAERELPFPVLITLKAYEEGVLTFGNVGKRQRRNSDYLIVD